MCITATTAQLWSLLRERQSWLICFQFRPPQEPGAQGWGAVARPKWHSRSGSNLDVRFPGSLPRFSSSRPAQPSHSPTILSPRETTRAWSAKGCVCSRKPCQLGPGSQSVLVVAGFSHLELSQATRALSGPGLGETSGDTCPSLFSAHPAGHRLKSSPCDPAVLLRPPPVLVLGDQRTLGHRVQG